jgi:hypothetical protein
MDKTEIMFETDPIASQLYLEGCRRTRILQPEKELMLAILTDAIECLQKHCGSRQASGTKLFQEARDWIFDENEGHAFSFLNVCDALELDPQYIRRGIAQLKARLSVPSAVKESSESLVAKSKKRDPRTNWSVTGRAHRGAASRAK